jgi:hypothetical protein
MKIGVNRNTASVEFQDQVFEIKIIPIFAEYLISEHDKCDKEFQKKDPTEEEVYAHVQESIDYLLKITEVILLANGYEFNKKWWKENADSRTLVEFIANCKLKDFTPKKKAAESQSAK